MTAKRIKFFQQDAAAPLPEPPRLAICADCLEDANPAAVAEIVGDDAVRQSITNLENRAMKLQAEQADQGGGL